MFYFLPPCFCICKLWLAISPLVFKLQKCYGTFWNALGLLYKSYFGVYFVRRLSMGLAALFLKGGGILWVSFWLTGLVCLSQHRRGWRRNLIFVILSILTSLFWVLFSWPYLLSWFEKDHSKSNITNLWFVNEKIFHSLCKFKQLNT